ncbi:class I SAM-dependent methyltransferase [Nakamurella sp. GG22]
MSAAAAASGPPAPTAGPPVWTAADTEPVSCAMCGVAGSPLYRRDPFGVVRCPECGLVFVSPRLTSQALQRLYDEPAYFEGGVYGAQSRWSPAMVLQRTWMAGRLRAISRLTPAPARLLEIGSGYGLFLDAARGTGYRVSGVELSRPGTQHAVAQYGLDVFQGQLADSPRAVADVICFWDTLEHVPDPLEFLGEVRARLAPGGIFALSVPNVASLPARVTRSRWWTLKPEQHIWHLSPATLRLLAARAGLEISTVVTSPLRRPNAGRTDSLFALGHAAAEPGE